MIDSSFTVRIEYEISRTHLAGLHCFSHIRLRTGIVRKADAKMTEYGECKSGTVRPLGQAGAAPYVGIAQELQCVVYNLSPERSRRVGLFLQR